MENKIEKVISCFDRFWNEKMEGDGNNKNARMRSKKRLFMMYYKGENPCIDCGEADPVVLEFDHLDLSAKMFTISQGVHKSWEELVGEIAKCDVRCANCHRRKSTRDKDYLKEREGGQEARLRARIIRQSCARFEKRQKLSEN